MGSNLADPAINERTETLDPVCGQALASLLPAVRGVPHIAADLFPGAAALARD
jgi:hypothetical protein